jgi:hypothetical protein
MPLPKRDIWVDYLVAEQIRYGGSMKVLSKTIGAICVAFMLLHALPVHSQTPLTNDAVVKMVKAGLAEDVILSMINTQPAQFSVTPDAMIALKKDGISDKVIAAMVTKSQPAGSGATPAAAAAPRPPAADSTANLEIGVYFKKQSDWIEITPEVVNWKTGGFLKTVGTGGLVKGDVNGNIKGAQSRNKVTIPLEFLIKTAEGVAITEYQLIRLHQNKNDREFRTVTGGVLHASGGATRDVIEFEGKRVGTRTFSVVLPEKIGTGEYGFLPPGAFGSANSASIGKMFTFRVAE